MFDDLLSVNAMLLVLAFAFASVLLVNIVSLVARLFLSAVIKVKKL